jgi:hypothetical protein
MHLIQTRFRPYQHYALCILHSLSEGRSATENSLAMAKKLEISGDTKFQGIEKFNHTKAYLFYAGNLKWVK